MAYDTLTAGVELGGLRTKQEIKVLICYLLNKLNVAVEKIHISEILQIDGLANYFEINECISELISKKNILYDEINKTCSIAESGRLIAVELKNSLPLTIKQYAVSNAEIFLKRIKNERENKVEIKEISQGYNVKFKVSGGDFPLMEMSLYVPDYEEAIKIKKNFYENPQEIYNAILAIFTKNKYFTKDLFKFLNSQSNKLSE